MVQIEGLKLMETSKMFVIEFVSLIAGCLSEDILFWAAENGKYWNEGWKVFLTPKIKSAVLKWDPSVLKFAKQRCKVSVHYKDVVLFILNNQRGNAQINIFYLSVVLVSCGLFGRMCC